MAGSAGGRAAECQSGLRAFEFWKGIGCAGFRSFGALPPDWSPFHSGRGLAFWRGIFAGVPARKHGGFCHLQKGGGGEGRAGRPSWPLGPMLVLPSRVSSLLEAALWDSPSARQHGDPLARVSLASLQLHLAFPNLRSGFPCVFQKKGRPVASLLQSLHSHTHRVARGSSFPS